MNPDSSTFRLRPASLSASCLSVVDRCPLFHRLYRRCAGFVPSAKDAAVWNWMPPIHPSLTALLHWALSVANGWFVRAVMHAMPSNLAVILGAFAARLADDPAE